jgi:hypothetical protein
MCLNLKKVLKFFKFRPFDIFMPLNLIVRPAHQFEFDMPALYEWYLMAKTRNVFFIIQGRGLQLKVAHVMALN